MLKNVRKLLFQLILYITVIVSLRFFSLLFFRE